MPTSKLSPPFLNSPCNFYIRLIVKAARFYFIIIFGILCTWFNACKVKKNSIVIITCIYLIPSLFQVLKFNLQTIKTKEEIQSSSSHSSSSFYSTRNGRQRNEEGSVRRCRDKWPPRMQAPNGEGLWPGGVRSKLPYQRCVVSSYRVHQTQDSEASLHVLRLSMAGYR